MGHVNQTMRVAASKSLDGPWELVYFRANGSSWWPDGIDFPWSEQYNCNVNNPAGWALLENNSLVMCYEASVVSSRTSLDANQAESSVPVNPQATAFLISDSGDWRGPWREVTPGFMPVGYPNGHQGNA